MDVIKKTLRASSVLFTLAMLVLCIFQLYKKVEQIYVIDVLLILALLFIVILGLILSRNLSLHNKFLNYLIPYFLVMVLLFAGVYLVNYINISAYIDFRILGLGFTGFYFIYVIISLYISRKYRNRIHF